MVDLVLRGGTVIDPGQGIDGPFDVVVEGERVGAVVPEAMSLDATRVIDVRGKYVVPGLVDLHTHIFWGVHGLGLDVDSSVLVRGVTTAVDGGSCGPENFAAF
ncbi:MAG: amidohydrolase family protein, partial [Chloroflexota bacterium]